MPTVRPDGSAPADRHQTVVIDRDDPADRWRYTCPRGHRNWTPTNRHIWCQSCARQHAHEQAVDPEHHMVVDRRTGREIPWHAVTLK